MPASPRSGDAGIMPPKRLRRARAAILAAGFAAPAAVADAGPTPTTSELTNTGMNHDHD